MRAAESDEGVWAWHFTTAQQREVEREQHTGTRRQLSLAQLPPIPNNLAVHWHAAAAVGDEKIM